MKCPICLHEKPKLAKEASYETIKSHIVNEHGLTETNASMLLILDTVTSALKE